MGVWIVLMMVLDRDALLLLYDLVGRDQTGVVVTLSLIVGFPLLIEAARNAPRYHRLWKTRALRDPAVARWTTDVPAATPRRFRVRGRVGELTWRERAIVEQGQLAIGRIERHGALCSVRYDAPWGEAIASLPTAVDGAPPAEGTPAPLLYEPHTSMGVAPSLVGVDFFVPDAGDQRAALTAIDTEARKTARGVRGPTTLPVCATLHPVERMARHRSVEVGTLSLSEEQMTLTLGHAEPITVRLDRPFRVEVATYLRADGQAELSVSFEPRTTSAYRTGEQVPLRLKTELPQGRIDRSVPVGWMDAGYIARTDFDRLWEVVVAATGDSTLSAHVALAS